MLSRVRLFAASLAACCLQGFIMVPYIYYYIWLLVHPMVWQQSNSINNKSKIFPFNGYKTNKTARLFDILLPTWVTLSLLHTDSYYRPAGSSSIGFDNIANPNRGGTTRVGFVNIIKGKPASPFFGGLSVTLSGGKARKKH